MSHRLRCGRFLLDLSKPLVMGIVNLTDDSFSGDGLSGDLSAVVAQADRMIAEGADILDLGAESSRPGALPVPPDQELARVVAAVEALRGRGIPLSVDTVRPEVMQAALKAGVDLVNDIAALRVPGAIEAVAGSAAAVCLMHMQGQPRSMQEAPTYGDVVQDVKTFLAARVAAAENAGIARDRIVLDPGFGFGKTTDHNWEILRRLDEFGQLGLPLLVGLSRKSMLGSVTGRDPGERQAASAAAALLAVQRGARIVRVHDVAATRDALAVLAAVQDQQGE
ncbi:MAG: dihydropteroate synthase [Rhodocyclaceae bacterium]|nr:dihydropteroate synthase [Rhodocyclaceae bacterium]